MINISVKKLINFDPELSLPFYATEEAAGADVYACLEDGESIKVLPFERVLIPTGLAFDIPRGYEIQVRPRSGMSLKTGIVIVNAPGTIDSDYRGELKIIVSNFSMKDEIITHGMKIAQLVVAPSLQMNLIESKDLSESLRGKNGFGSTDLQLI